MVLVHVVLNVDLKSNLATIAYLLRNFCIKLVKKLSKYVSTEDYNFTW